jgi:plastocyanin
MKKILFIGLVAIAVLVSGCYQPSTNVNTTIQQGGGTPAGAGAGNAVTIQNFAFNPVTITISKGQTVTWTNMDSAPHTVTSTTGYFDSGPISQGQTFSHTFNTAGTFEYSCTIHPSIPHGTVIVT